MRTFVFSNFYWRRIGRTQTIPFGRYFACPDLELFNFLTLSAGDATVSRLLFRTRWSIGKAAETHRLGHVLPVPDSAKERGPTPLFLSSLLAASSDGETFLGSGVVSGWLRPLAQWGGAGEPVSRLTASTSRAQLTHRRNHGHARSWAFPAKCFSELPLTHLTTEQADSTARCWLLLAASTSACFITQSDGHIRRRKESSRNV